MQFWFSKLVFGSPEQFMRKKHLLLNHICQCNDSPRHAACVLMQQQKQVKCGTKGQDWDFSTSYVFVSYQYPASTMNVCAHFLSENCCSAVLMLWIWTGWTLWAKAASNRKSRERSGEFAQVHALAVLSHFTCTLKKWVAVSTIFAAEKFSISWDVFFCEETKILRAF